MFKGVDHIVVAVKDLDAAVGRYETIYNTKCPRSGTTKPPA